jgi:putative oxidoreductase
VGWTFPSPHLIILSFYTMFTLQESHVALVRRHGIVLARIFLGALFFLSGLQIILGGAAGLAGTTSLIEKTDLPLASLLAIIVVLIKVGGGAALILGIKTREAAAALFLFTGAASLAFHMAPVEQMGLFGYDMGLFKNLAIMGGLLYAIAYGPGDGWKLRG